MFQIFSTISLSPFLYLYLCKGELPVSGHPTGYLEHGRLWGALLSYMLQVTSRRYQVTNDDTPKITGQSDVMGDSINFSVKSCAGLPPSGRVS